MILQLIDTKKEHEKKLYSLLSRYISKYIQKKFDKEKDSKKAYSKFQKALVKIAKWSPDDVHKEYKKYIKWCVTKKTTSEQDLCYLFKSIIKLYIKIMLNKDDVYVDYILSDYRFPTLQDFFYKALKTSARIFYDNPSTINEIDNINFESILENIINLYIPASRIMELLDSDKTDTSTSDGHVFRYNFDLLSEESNIEEDEDNKEQDKHEDEEKGLPQVLKYISPERFHENYDCDNESSRHTRHSRSRSRQRHSRHARSRSRHTSSRRSSRSKHSRPSSRHSRHSRHSSSSNSLRHITVPRKNYQME
jgi:hypothetical protein